MPNRAKNLLCIHKYLLSRESVLVAYIASLGELLRHEDADDIIDALSLTPKPLGMPPSGRRPGNPTEHVALCYEAELRTQMDEIRATIGEACRELRQVRINLSLYDAVMKSLNEAEARFVLLHYDERMSMNRIAEVDLVPGAQTMYSASTLRRLNAGILEKIDAALGPEQG